MGVRGSCEIGDLFKANENNDVCRRVLLFALSSRSLYLLLVLFHPEMVHIAFESGKRERAQRYIKHVHWKSEYVCIHFIQVYIFFHSFDALANSNEM